LTITAFTEIYDNLSYLYLSIPIKVPNDFLSDVKPRNLIFNIFWRFLSVFLQWKHIYIFTWSLLIQWTSLNRSCFV